MERKDNKNLMRQKAEELMKKKSEAKIPELIKELAFQNEEKAKRADELLIANKELAFQNEEKAKRADELNFAIANSLRLTHELEVHQIELKLQNDELLAAQLAAVTSAEKYLELYDLAPSGYYTLSRKGEIIELNLTGAKMLGKDRQHLKNSLYGFFVSEETKPIFSLFLEKAFKSKSNESCEVVIDKEYRLPFHGFLTGVVEGNPEQCFVTMVDISERKRAEEKLHVSEETFRSIFENSSAAMAIIEPDTTISMVNEEYCKLIGATKQEIIGTSWIRQIPPQDRERLKEYNRQRLINPKAAPEKYEFTFYHNNGEIKHALMSISMLSNRTIIASFIDITQRLIAENEVKQLSDRLSLATRAGGVGVWDYDVVNNILLWDDQMFSLYGINRNDFGGVYEAWQAGMHPDDKERGSAEIQMAINGEKEFDTEFRVLWPDGNIHNIRALAIVQRDDSGKPFRMIGTNWDITAQKQAENEIRLLNETLEQSVAERTDQLVVINKELAFHLSELEQFSYVSNHDLQEPLRTLIQFTKLFCEKYAGTLDEDGTKYIEFISKSAVRMSALVKDLLDYSLLGKNNVKTIIDCNKIIEAVLSDLDDSIKGRSAKLTIQKLPTINGSETELRLLFQNLIANAIKYQKPDMVPEINISAESHEKDWLFSIKDNGIGIDKKYHDKIFIIFQRLHNRNEFEGTGIGLAHCKKIVELHGGMIWVESTPGAGSTFMFTIPKR